MLISEFEHRRVGILGAGREGLATWRWLRRQLPDLAVTVFSEAPVAQNTAGDLAAAGAKLREGPLKLESLAGFDILVRSPGISPYRPELQDLERVRFTSASNLWFAEHPQARTICITGTKGKSTTTALTAHLLRAAGLNAVEAGNIGCPMLEMRAEGVDWWVIELSSYQLCDLQARPRLAAILNLADEHLDWHMGPDVYRRDKLRLAAMVPPKRLIANHRNAVLREQLGTLAGVRWFNRDGAWQVVEGRVNPPGSSGAGLHLPGVPGRHNLDNLAAALTLCEEAGGLPANLPDALANFRGLPHRLDEIGSRDGRRYIDDSLSTTPVAVLAALEAFAGEPVTLLLGGLDRGVDWAGWMGRFESCLPQSIIALPDNGPHILEVFRQAGLEPAGGMREASSLEAAVELAGRLTPRGGMVLLSPGAPSFPHFRDYRERGEAFAKAAGLAGSRGNE